MHARRVTEEWTMEVQVSNGVVSSVEQWSGVACISDSELAEEIERNCSHEENPGKGEFCSAR